MCPFSGKNLCPETFPYFYWKLIECRDRRNEGNAWRTCDPEIEFFSGTFVGEIPNPVGKSRWRFREPLDF